MIIMFNEKVVLVTGGTRGIGYTTVEEFLKGRSKSNTFWIT